MSQSLVYLLIFVALVLPVPGALALRVLGGRIGERAVIVGAAALFALAIGGALVLARADVGLLRVGDLTLLLPGTARGESQALPPELAAAGEPAAAPDEGPPLIPTLTPRPSATPRPSPTPRPSAPPRPSATPEPSPTVEPSATPEPTAAPAAPAGEPQRYTVQAGDTFRAIAERFGVSVADLLEANDLTPAQADSLRVGQELIIP
jgi:LysM repeat protein